ncbi:hypothetical protein KBK19_18755 [Microvirga sp. STR05]|uniref:Oxalate:formate antiporter n=1 Tax=Hymenobacter duratus TaxID=2771356 RepID=A0ABR8JNA8_9BACT|nr:hypothetical protein [Hymenobacter duratus]MBD2717091.1 hypothetical protein [Hymenobacter duratus]MBR7952007.1 hypothetical protein [Microvirga sp. STR05]
MDQKTSYPTSDATPSSTGAVAFAWLFVGVPLAWGVSQTFIKALALFQ